MMGRSVESPWSAKTLRRSAYSRPAATSWMEQGQTTTKRGGSRRSNMARTSSRDLNTVSAARDVSGTRFLTSSGVANRSLEATLTFCNRSWMLVTDRLHGRSDGPKLRKEPQLQRLGEIGH